VHFNFNHYQALASAALDHYCTTVSKPFSFVHATRPSEFSSECFETCLRDIIECIPSQAWLWHFITPLTASALVMANYPPDSHCKLLRSLL
jgi:hypothetical protein